MGAWSVKEMSRITGLISKVVTGIAAALPVRHRLS